MKKYIVLSFLLALSIVSYSPKKVSACTSIYFTVEDGLKNYGAIFQGKALSSTQKDDGETVTITYDFEVEKYWKGQVPKKITLTTKYFKGFTCGPLTLKIDEPTIIFVYPDTLPSTSFSTNGGASMSVNSEILEKLGLAKTPDNVNFQNIFQSDLSVGQTNPDVANLQTWLIEHGFNIPAISSGITSKGYFGSQTKSAVAKYQLSIGLPGTGFVGPLTRTKLNGTVAGPAFNIISPNGNERWQIGTTRDIRWNTPVFIRATTVDIKLIEQIPYFDSRLNCLGGFVCEPTRAYGTNAIRSGNIYNIAKGINIENKLYKWNVGNYVEWSNDSQILPGSYLVQICQTGTTVCTVSKSAFTIFKNEIEVLAPNGGELWMINSAGRISWKITNSQNTNQKVDLYLSEAITRVVPCPECQDMGYAQNTIAEKIILLDKNINASLAYDWIVGTDISNKLIPAGRYFMRVCLANTTECDYSDSPFTISNPTPAPSITVLTPNGGEVWKINSAGLISWGLNSNLSPNTKVDINLIPQYPICNGLACPMGAQTSVMYPYHAPYVLDKNISGNAAYNWIVGTDIINDPIPAGNYKVEICIKDSRDCDISNTDSILIN